MHKLRFQHINTKIITPQNKRHVYKLTLDKQSSKVTKFPIRNQNSADIKHENSQKKTPEKKRKFTKGKSSAKKDQI